MTTQPSLSDETYNALKRELDCEKTVDLPRVIAFHCGVVRLPGTLQIDVEEDYDEYLKKFPLQG